MPSMSVTSRRRLAARLAGAGSATAWLTPVTIDLGRGAYDRDHLSGQPFDLLALVRIVGLFEDEVEAREAESDEFDEALRDGGGQTADELGLRGRSEAHDEVVDQGDPIGIAAGTFGCGLDAGHHRGDPLRRRESQGRDPSVARPTDQIEASPAHRPEPNRDLVLRFGEQLGLGDLVTLAVLRERRGRPQTPDDLHGL